ncbi:glycoside hydrolase family protein [Maritalea sp.]|uniref:glycoside hydrolase family protein n=1 Tax=Maritalea sp. TaxID=2003361 RepID=UPI003EF3DC6A
MKLDREGQEYTLGHEGVVLTCYLDPVGVPTIFAGITMRSRVAREYFKNGLIPGKTKITYEEGMKLFKALAEEVYEPPTRKGMPGAKQHEFNAGFDNCYNMGPATFGWKWAKLWRAGKKRLAAIYLETHYHKAKGKVLPGLVRRRFETSQILLHGKYPKHHMGEGVPRTATKTRVVPDPVVKEAQELLTTRGFNPGAIDGWMGQKTKMALLAYQEAHPHLVNDGILDPATLAQLRRDAQMAGQVAKDAMTKGGGGSLVGGIGAFMAGLPWGWIAAGVVAGVIVWTLWRHRDVLQRRWNAIRGHKVIV